MKNKEININDLRKNVIEFININNEYEKIMHIDNPWKTGAFIYEKDTMKACDIFDRLDTIKAKIRKQVGFWNYMIFSFNRNYFYEKFNLIKNKKG